MTDKNWTKEKYEKLEKMVKQKWSPGDIAVALKVKKSDLPYRLKLLRTQSVIQTWVEGEIELLEQSKNLDSFLEGCIKLFGKHRDNNILIDHWMKRETYLASWYKEKEEKKKIHEVIIVNPKITKPRIEDERDPFPDVGELLAKLIGCVQENTVVLKEQLQVQKDTYTLFKSKLEQSSKKEESL